MHEGADLAANAITTQPGSPARSGALYAAIILFPVGARGLFAGSGHTPPRPRPATAA